MKLLVVGTVAFDDVETPFGLREGILGGSATHFSYAASFFTKVGLVGAVGGDFPDEFLRVIDDRGIDRTGLQRLEGQKTFHWSGKYVGDMNEAETLDTRLNVLDGYRPVVPDRFGEIPFVFLANGEPNLQLATIDQVRPRFLVCDTMNLWIDTALEGLKKVLARVNGIILNDGEAKLLTGERNLICAAEAVAAMGPSTVIVKRGEYGSFLLCDEGRFAIPAYPLQEVIDPTGAGDSFAGGVMGYIAEKGSTTFADLKRAMAYGTVTASFNVEDFSLDNFKRISRSDIDRRFEEFLAFTSF